MTVVMSVGSTAIPITVPLAPATNSPWRFVGGRPPGRSSTPRAGTRPAGRELVGEDAPVGEPPRAPLGGGDGRTVLGHRGGRVRPPPGRGSVRTATAATGRSGGAPARRQPGRPGVEFVEGRRTASSSSSAGSWITASRCQTPARERPDGISRGRWRCGRARLRGTSRAAATSVAASQAVAPSAGGRPPPPRRRTAGGGGAVEGEHRLTLRWGGRGPGHRLGEGARHTSSCSLVSSRATATRRSSPQAAARSARVRATRCGAS